MNKFPGKPHFPIPDEERTRAWQIVDANLAPIQDAIIVALRLADSKEAFEAGGNHAIQFLFRAAQLEAFQDLLRQAKESLEKQRPGPRLVQSKAQVKS